MANKIQIRSTGIIYKVEAPNGKCYIGQTRQSLQARKNRHYYDATNKKISKLSSAIQKYNLDLKWSIVENNIPVEQLDEKERYYISYYNSFNNGYNMTIGGQNPPLTKTTKEKISKAQIGRKASEETKQKISKSHQGKHTGKLNCMYGKIIKGTTHAEKISKANKGKKKAPFSNKHKEKLAEKKGAKAFYVYDKNNLLVGSWINRSECAHILGICRGTVDSCLNGKYKQSKKGYKFTFVSACNG